MTRVSVGQPLAEPIEEINSGESEEEDEIVFDENLEVEETDSSFQKSPIDALIANRSQEVGPRLVSEIQVGDRLPGENPQGNDGSNELEFLLKPHCVYSLRYEKEDEAANAVASSLSSRRSLYERVINMTGAKV